MTHTTLWFSLLCSLAVLPRSAVAEDDDSYVYRLVDGKQAKVCRHMQRVYNDKFRRPWSFQDYPISTPPFARLPGVDYDERKALDLRFSAFPSSEEFDAIQWREGRMVVDTRTNATTPMLVATADIDNDGKQDLLVKTSFMLSYSRAHRSVPGGDDHLFVLDKNQMDLHRNPTSTTFYGHVGQPRPALVNFMTLGLGARSIRPLVYDGITYLHVYEQRANDEDKLDETIWLLRYRGGGGNLGPGKWDPVRGERVCRFRMTASEKRKGLE